MKRALVLAGGGARGSYQVGMLQELVLNKGLDFSIIRGVSVGALNASLLAQAPVSGGSRELGKRVEALYKLWSGIKGNQDIYSDRGGFPALVAGADSLYSLEPLRRLINQNVSLKDLRTSGRDFAVGTVSLVSGYYQEWTPEDKDFINKLVASASIPVVFPYVDIKSGKDILVDGGVRNITPLSSAFAAEPDEIYILLTSRLISKDTELPDSGVQKNSYAKWTDNWLGTKVSGFDVLKRTLDILTDEVYLDDIRGALHWNKVADSIMALKKASEKEKLPAGLNKKIKHLLKTLKDVKKRPVAIYVIAPQEWFGEENKSTEFSPELIKRAIKHGKAVAADKNQWVLKP